jgi:hypothetical protein
MRGRGILRRGRVRVRRERERQIDYYMLIEI